MAESSAAEENIELANLPAEGGASEAAADADGEETNISAGEEKSDGEKATDEAKATDATEDNIERAEDIENGEATADTGDPVSPDPPKTVNVVEEAPKQSSPKKAKKSSRDNQKLRVFLLDGRTLDLERGRKPYIEAVVDPAHSESQTLELDFFSAYFYDDYVREHHGNSHRLRQKIFLVPKKQLRSQYSPAEREKLEDPWEYHYGVKFYVPDPNNSRLLKDDHSRYLMCLQLCDDIRCNRILVDRETAIRLTAIMLQGKLGDYEEDVHLPGYCKEFPQFQLLPDSLKPESYESQVVQVHKAKAGYTPSQCDAEFLSIAKDLKRYGEHFFLAKSHRDDSLKECRMVTIGNGCRGVSVYCEDEEDIHVPWKDIVKISYKKDKFRIIYRASDEVDGAEESSSKKKTIKRKFYTGQRPQAKRIWKNAVEQHVFFHLDSTATPNIIGNVFLRSSMRYSFKKTLPSARKNPEPVPTTKDRPRELVPIEPAPQQEGGDNWVILSQPPKMTEEDDTFQEEQKVQIDFSNMEGEEEEPEAHRFVIHRDSTGSYELVDRLQREEQEDDRERTFSLSVIDENSKASRVSVCLQIDSPHSQDSFKVSTLGRGTNGKGVPIFDSDRMPVVNLGANSKVTTGTVIQKDGKQLTVGEHSQKYPLQNGRYGEEGFAGPAVDGSEEAEQVNKFLDSEHKAFQRPGVFSPEEVEVESDVELHPTTADSGGEPEASNKDSEFQIEDGVEMKLL